MTDIPFEVGKKYKFQSADGWAEFVCYVPQAQDNQKLVFFTHEGDVITRYTDGTVQEYPPRLRDILPEKYVEPFTPKIGRWRRRDGSEDIIVAFNPEDPYPIMGVKSAYTSNGRFYNQSKKSSIDLIEWLGPIPEECLTWEEDK